VNWRTRWHHHPGVRTGDQLTFGERAADKMRNGMGSWAFIFLFLTAMLVWAGTNTLFIGRALGHKAFDPYPYILLNLLLSTLAGLQGGILLIAAKRADQVSSELAQHDYEADCRSRELLEQLAMDFAQLRADHSAMAQRLEDLHQGMGNDHNSGP
jgi:uncharacterized membrane protein